MYIEYEPISSISLRVLMFLYSVDEKMGEKNSLLLVLNIVSFNTTTEN